VDAGDASNVHGDNTIAPTECQGKADGIDAARVDDDTTTDVEERQEFVEAVAGPNVEDEVLDAANTGETGGRADRADEPRAGDDCGDEELCATSDRALDTAEPQEEVENRCCHKLQNDATHGAEQPEQVMPAETSEDGKSVQAHSLSDSQEDMQLLKEPQLESGEVSTEAEEESNGQDATEDAESSGDDKAAVASMDAKTQAPPMQPVFNVQATLPQDLSFKAPKGCVPGQVLCVQGPHGPLHVQAPPGVKAGQTCTVRLAAPFHHEVFVPAGARPGQKVTFTGENDEELEAIVPPGKRPGETFRVSPPVVMVPVPPGAVTGNLIAFTTPKGDALIAPVPENVGFGQYFAVRY
jgi:hypothetical protein